MNEVSLFLVGALTLLGTPGPTNTLLATSGAVVGFRKSLRLLIGEICGYLIAISVLGVIVGPIWTASPIARASLKICCGIYLVFLTMSLWRKRPLSADQESDISTRKVFITTLLNPKAAAFAFIVIPHLADGDYPSAAPYLAATAGLIMLVGTSWIGVGALIKTSGGRHLTQERARRLGAIPLGVFATLLIALSFRS